MENLENLKIKRERMLEKIDELKRKLKEEQDKLNDLKDEIAEMEGVPEEMEDIREEADNFTKDIKERPRPTYKKSEETNMENNEVLEETNQENEITEIERDSEINTDEDELGNQMNESNMKNLTTTQERNNVEITKGFGNNVDERKRKMTTPEIIEKDMEESENELPKKKKIKTLDSVKRINDLLKELSEEELKELEEIELGREEIMDGLTQLFHNACEQERKLKKNKRKVFLSWYEYIEEFNRRIEILKREEITITTRVITERLYKEIKEKCVIYNSDNIRKKTEKAKKIYRILSKIGGKEKIGKLEKLNTEKFAKLTIGEIEEWEKSLSMREQETLMSGSTTPTL